MSKNQFEVCECGCKQLICKKCGEQFHPYDNHECEAIPIDDPIKPDHYKVGGMEPIEYMQIKMTPEQFKGFLIGNVLKYVSRYPHKNGVEDLNKAKWYLDKLINLERE